MDLLGSYIHVLAFAPISFTIAVIKAQFGQYWWAIIICAVIVIYWGSQQKE